MDSNLTGIVVTGASGFIGRHFLDAVKSKYRLFCLARRSQKEAGIPKHDNIRWMQVDIARWDNLREVVSYVKDNGRADFVLHLAGYYDFGNADNPEYQRTNVQGTRNVLKLASQIGTRRFLFTSSLAACTFPQGDDTITEQSAPDADFPYARSKRRGEELIREHADWFPSAIIRLAAIYSDWCEYPPLYVFLNTWLSGRWNARVIGGKGQSAVTYLHVSDLVAFFVRIMERTDSLPRLGVYVASPSTFATHLDLFRTTTRYFYGRDIKPVHVPKVIAASGLWARQMLGRMTGNPPFERLWMASYIDRKLNVDASFTHKELDWQPRQRYGVLRRLLFLMENMKSHPDAWHLCNEEALKRVARRPNLDLYAYLAEHRESLTGEIYDSVSAPENVTRFQHYLDLDDQLLKWYIALIYQLLCTVVRIRDRTLIRSYADTIARRRYAEGFPADEVCDFLLTVGDVVGASLIKNIPWLDIEQRTYDMVNMTFQLAVDEVQDAYDFLISESGQPAARRVASLPVVTGGELEHFVYELEEISQDAWEARLSEEIRKLQI